MGVIEQYNFLQVLHDLTSMFLAPFQALLRTACREHWGEKIMQIHVHMARLHCVVRHIVLVSTTLFYSSSCTPETQGGLESVDRAETSQFRK